MSDRHPCAKLGKEGESNFKTKDRLGDNEWCKSDDLLASTERPHSHTLLRLFFLFLFFPFFLSMSLSLSVWPKGLIRTEKRLIFLGQNVFVTSYNGVEGVGN